MAVSLGSPRALTELEAVNLVLRVGGGERPTTTLNDGVTVEGTKAHTVLRGRMLTVLTHGYEFNKVHNVTLRKSTNGEVQIPDNVLEFTPSGADYYELYQKVGNRVYNRDGGTFQIDKDVLCTTMVSLKFEDLPQAARWYLAVTSALEYSNDYHPGDASVRVTVRDVDNALVGLERMDARRRPGGMKHRNPHYRKMIGVH